MDGTCRGCCYRAKVVEGDCKRNECRRFPPQIVSDTYSTESDGDTVVVTVPRSVFPIAELRCGEYKETK